MQHKNALKIPMKKRPEIVPASEPLRRAEDIVPKIDVPKDGSLSHVRIMGIDYSLTGTGIVVINGDGDVLFKVTKGESLPKTATLEQKVRRVVNIAQNVVSVMRSMRVTHVAMEASLFKGSSGQGGSYGVEDTAGGRWVILSQILLAMNAVPAEFSPASARKITLGKGNTPKDQVKGEVFKRYAILFQDGNQADAFVVARALYGVLRDAVDAKPKPEQPRLF